MARVTGVARGRKEVETERRDAVAVETAAVVAGATEKGRRKHRSSPTKKPLQGMNQKEARGRLRKSDEWQDKLRNKG